MPLKSANNLESARLLIRPVTEADLPALLEVNGDDAVTQYLPYASWRSIEDARAWFARMNALQAAGGALQFVIIEKRTARAIGTCLLFHHEETSARAELGYVLGRRHWGQGYMDEALRRLVDCAFGELALRRLEAEVDPRNARSARVLSRLGFVQEGLLRERWLTRGIPCSVNVYGLLQREWPRA
ncbi:MAG TPA: GNAT family N-acetyltransferase [Steroidobacteraceae bacterium]|nr:GNAT family N-acetyltransferase [Steroidobacteraceae bacterium]